MATKSSRDRADDPCSCTCRCIFIKMAKTKKSPAQWRKVFSNCAEGCVCPKPPKSSAGGVGHIWIKPCVSPSGKSAYRAIQAPRPPQCTDSCLFKAVEVDGQLQWEKQTDCQFPAQCVCDDPPDPPQSLGEEYMTDCYKPVRPSQKAARRGASRRAR